MGKNPESQVFRLPAKSRSDPITITMPATMIVHSPAVGGLLCTVAPESFVCVEVKHVAVRNTRISAHSAPGTHRGPGLACSRYAARGTLLTVHELGEQRVLQLDRGLVPLLFGELARRRVFGGAERSEPLRAARAELARDLLGVDVD